MAKKKTSSDKEKQDTVSTLTKEEKLKRIREMAAATNRDYEKKGGSENAHVGGEKRLVFFASEMTLRSVPLGFPEIDRITGGEPVGRIVVDYGPTDCGKSGWNYKKISIMQRQGLVCAVVNMENGFDPDWASINGVDLEELVIIDQQPTFEGTAQIMWNVMKERLVDHFLVDSIQGQLTNKELYKSSGNNVKSSERDLDDDTVGALPKKIGEFIRRLTPLFGKSDCTMTIIGQARDKIDHFGGMTLTGGHALKHAARRICQWRRAPKKEWPSVGDKILGFASRVTLELQQLNEHSNEFFFVPFRTGQGVWELKLYVEEAIRKNVILPDKGSYWTWTSSSGTTEKVNGAAALNNLFEQNPEYYQDLQSQLLKISRGEEDIPSS